MGEGGSLGVESEIQEQDAASSTKQKKLAGNLATVLLGLIGRKTEGILRNTQEPQVISEPNATANSYITPEMEDRQLLEEFEKVDPRERELALLQEKVQQSTLPSLDIFPPEFTEALAQKREEFRRFLDKLKRKEYIKDWPKYLENIKLNPVNYGFVSGIHDAYPKEYALAHLLQARNLLHYGKGLYLVDETVKDVQRVLKTEDENLKHVEELRNGHNYEAHGAWLDVSQSIFRSGYLGSRQSVLDRNGQINITTHGLGETVDKVIEYPDRFEITVNRRPGSGWDRVIRKIDARKSAEGNSLDQRSKRERYELLFSDGLYWGLDCINFVFPEAEILQGASWYVHDGLHVFNQDYDPKTNRKGYEISLKERRHFVVTSTKNREKLLGFIAQAGWIEDKDKYIRDNVVFIKSTKVSGPDIDQQVEILAQQKFKGLNYPRLGSHIVPTGTELTDEESVINHCSLYKLAA